MLWQAMSVLIRSPLRHQHSLHPSEQVPPSPSAHILAPSMQDLPRKIYNLWKRKLIFSQILFTDFQTKKMSKHFIKDMSMIHLLCISDTNHMVDGSCSLKCNAGWNEVFRSIWRFILSTIFCPKQQHFLQRNENVLNKTHHFVCQCMKFLPFTVSFLLTFLHEIFN